MTDKTISSIYADAKGYIDPNAFASDVSLSFLDPEDPTQEVDMVLYEQLKTLWRVVNDPFRELLSLIGLNQTQCSTRFCIPLRTVQSWALGERPCPSYVRLMMAELTGLLQLRNE